MIASNYNRNGASYSSPAVRRMRNGVCAARQRAASYAAACAGSRDALAVRFPPGSVVSSSSGQLYASAAAVQRRKAAATETAATRQGPKAASLDVQPPNTHFKNATAPAASAAKTAKPRGRFGRFFKGIVRSCVGGSACCDLPPHDVSFDADCQSVKAPSLYFDRHRPPQSTVPSATNAVQSTSPTDASQLSIIQSFIKEAATVRPGNLPKKSLLPRKKGSAARITLVLDLDETLSHSIVDDAASDKGFKKNSRSRPPDHVFETMWNWETKRVYVYLRPKLADFLGFVARHFEVVLFTASLAQFADPVIDCMERMCGVSRGGIFSHRLYRDSCTFHTGLFVKDLSSLNRNTDNVVIVDNSPYSFAWHSPNAIPIKTWTGDETDVELQRIKNILCTLLETFAAADDRQSQ